MTNSFFCSAKQVRGILGSTGSCREIAAKYGVSEGTVRDYKLLRSRKARAMRSIMQAEGKDAVLWRRTPPKIISAKTVRAILAANGTHREIADAYDVSIATVWLYRSLGCVKAQAVYADMLAAGESVGETKRGTLRNLVATQVREILESPENSVKLAKEYGISSSSIRMLRTGRTYKNVI